MVVFLSSCSKMIVLDSKGPIGQEETFLIYTAFALMLIVVIPVFIMAFWFAIKYRASNKKANYQPNWSHSTKIEWVIWMVPIAIIIALSYLTWTRTYQLDPYKPIPSETKPLNVEVVSLDWNWLFIYPDYNLATVNELIIPTKTPISFKLTSATVMTSFFIPQLGSQMYAMAGMRTRLNLLADEPGTYEGHNLEFSGKGYNTMHFDVLAKDPEAFQEWVKQAMQSPDSLTMPNYVKLSEPSTNYPITTYKYVVPGLFNHIMSKYMGWMGTYENKKMDMPKDHSNGHKMNHKTMEDK